MTNDSKCKDCAKKAECKTYKGLLDSPKATVVGCPLYKKEQK